MSASSEESAVSAGHQVLEDGAGSFLSKERTQAQLSEVGRGPNTFLQISPQQSLQTHSTGEMGLFLVPQPCREVGSQVPGEPHTNFLYAAFLGGSGESAFSSWVVGGMVLSDSLCLQVCPQAEQTPPGQGLPASPLYNPGAQQGLGAE